MTDIKKVDFIPNWGVFEPEQVQIHLEHMETEDGGSYYRALLFIFLPSFDNSDYNVTLVTDLSHEDPKQCAKITFIYASTLFPDISPKVVVFTDDNMETKEVIDLRNENMAEGKSVH